MGGVGAEVTVEAEEEMGEAKEEVTVEAAVTAES